MSEQWFDIEIRNKAAAAAKEREERRKKRQEKDRRRALIQRVVLVALLLALVVIVVARVVHGTGEEAQGAMATATERVENTVAIIDPDMGLVDPGTNWKLTAAMPTPTEPPEEEPVDPQEVTDAIVEILLAQGYLSDAVPLPYEYQDYMRFFSLAYGCPYPLALAVADRETRGTFDMEAVGAVGEVGIFQLNPGPEGAYHAELERATGMDPTTPIGNIACGCYLLGKYLDDYNGDVAKAAMAYNMGVAGATKAWNKGITSTEYSDTVLANVEKWEAAVNAWRGF